MSTPVQKQARQEGKGKDKGKAEVPDDPSMENDGERPAAGSSPRVRVRVSKARFAMEFAVNRRIFLLCIE